MTSEHELWIESASWSTTFGRRRMEMLVKWSEVERRDDSLRELIANPQDEVDVGSSNQKDIKDMEMTLVVPEW